MSLCIAAAGKVLVMATTAFTLSWSHSVERIAWEEDWRVAPSGLEIIGARVRGSGAGMEPPPDARFHDGWWHYTPRIPILPEVVLATSSATRAWSLCAAGDCIEVGTEAGDPVVLTSCTSADY